MVQRLYEIFRTTRSIQSTAKQMNEEGFHTPSGAAFNASTTRLVLRNPIYCTADKRSYDYFIDHDGNVFGDMTEFDGTHGLSAYNKTDQEKYEGSDSTFISPKYVQTIESKPVSEWIIAVGRHEGFIPSEQWIEVQKLLDAIAEKYNRPHRKTNALLAGLVHCPYCGRRLSVISESDRWTNGKPRFKYDLGDCSVYLAYADCHNFPKRSVVVMKLKTVQRRWCADAKQKTQTDSDAGGGIWQNRLTPKR